MGKKKISGTKYISKGERKNVSKSTQKLGRDEPKSVSSMIASSEHRRGIMSRSKDKSVAHLRERYINEDMIQKRADALFKKYANKGATWAACVQAVKTDWVSQFENKWTNA